MIVSDLFESAKFQRKEIGMGMEQMWNDDVAIVGGFRSGNSSAGLTRLKYMIYDLHGENEDPQDNEVGYVELFIKDGSGEIDGLVNINIHKQFRRTGAGIGRKVIEALVKTASGPFKVYDIKASAVPFWRKMGAKFYKADFKTPITNTRKHRHGIFGVIE